MTDEIVSNQLDFKWSFISCVSCLLLLAFASLLVKEHSWYLHCLFSYYAFARQPHYWIMSICLLWCASITAIIIWLAPRAGKMNQIACCDWLPERARWSHLARSGLPTVSRKQNCTKSHIINPLLTKFVRSRWLDIGLVLFLRVYGPRLCLGL